MNPGGPLLMAVNARLADDGFRQQVRDMHAKQTPLLDMVDSLGLAAEMSDTVRRVVANLDPAAVQAIRKATLDMLGRAENAMPLDCKISQAQIDDGLPVSVQVVDAAGVATIQVRPT
jgi:hypothetical protein